jgi:hypothetical protein
MKKTLTALALAASALSIAPQALAVDNYRAVASGAGEATPNPSPGYSIAHFELDGTMLTANVPFADLVAGATMAHIHCCTTDSFTGAAGVAIGFPDFPSGVTSGMYSKVFDLSDATIWNPTFLAAFGGTAEGASAAFLDALGEHTAYLNIHTTEYPGGEIRGFLVAAPIPEPATWGMLVVGLSGLGLMARRRVGTTEG